MYISFKEFIKSSRNYSGSAIVCRCYECEEFTFDYPLKIKHDKKCTTPKRIELYQTKEFQKMLLLIGTKENLIKQIKDLEKEKLKLLQHRGILENDPKWINDYIEALAILY